MYDMHDNPIFGTTHGALVPIPPSTCYEQPEPPKRRAVPPMVGEIVAKLGLRYRPAGAAVLHAHAEALILLGEDLADVPHDLLDEAARRWARREKFMPRASELRELCRAVQAERTAGSEIGARALQDHCDKLNAMAWCRDQWRVVGEAPNRRVDRVGGAR